MELIIPDWSGVPPNIGALSTLRRGGFSQAPYDDGCGTGGLNLGLHVGDNPEHVQRNRQLLESILPGPPVWLTQVHGTTVLDVPVTLNEAPQADASVTTQQGVVCAILTADCLPVLFCDAGGRVVGAAHAGWRGLAGGVLENTVAQMRAKGATEIFAWLGPAIGPEQFEVGKDVFDTFVARDSATSAAFKPIEKYPGKYLADIYELARIFLKSQDVKKIYGGTACTFSDTRRFYSFRRDKVTGRMATLIWIK